MTEALSEEVTEEVIEPDTEETEVVSKKTKPQVVLVLMYKVNELLEFELKFTSANVFVLSNVSWSTLVWQNNKFINSK